MDLDFSEFPEFAVFSHRLCFSGVFEFCFKRRVLESCFWGFKFYFNKGFWNVLLNLFLKEGFGNLCFLILFLKKIHV